MSESNEQNQNDQQEQGGEENVEGLKSALQKERDARGALDKDLKAVRRELDSLKNGSKTEAERLQALERERDTLMGAVRERDAKDAAHDIAGKLGADGKNAGVIWRAVKGDIEYDAAGRPTNLKTLIDDLKETTPHLFRKATGNADAGNGNSGRPKNFDMNAQIRQMAGRG